MSATYRQSSKRIVSSTIGIENKPVARGTFVYGRCVCFHLAVSGLLVDQVSGPRW